jgi:hypothetical protein
MSESLENWYNMTESQRNTVVKISESQWNTSLTLVNHSGTLWYNMTKSQRNTGQT